MLIPLPQTHNWTNLQTIPAKAYICGYCNNRVTSEKGFTISISGAYSISPGLYICNYCHYPTLFLGNGERFPSSAFGSPVKHVPDDITLLFEEARRCTSQNCFSSAVLTCRKILMHIGVAQGAPDNLKFVQYVDFLAEKGFVPPNGKHWVDHIRKKGNEANHEILIMNESDAKDLILFTEMLLKFIYEFPKLVPTSEEISK